MSASSPSTAAAVIQRTVKIDESAYLKLILHAALHPTQPITGILIGAHQAETNTTVVTDSYALTHHYALSPVHELALTLATTLSNDRIIGIYAIPQSLTAAPALSTLQQTVAQQISESVPHSIALLIDNALITHSSSSPLVSSGSSSSSSSPRSCIHLIAQTVNGKWRYNQCSTSASDATMIHLQLANDISETVREALTSRRWKEMCDFDDHMEDVTKDWTNPLVK